MRKSLIAGVLALLVAGCGNPLRDVPRLEEVAVDGGAGQADAFATDESADLPQVAVTTEDAPRKGLLGFLKRAADEADGAGAEVAVQEATVPEPGAPETDMASADAVSGDDEIVPETASVADAAVVPAEDALTRRGLFGLLGGARTSGEDDVVAAAAGPFSGAGGRRSARSLPSVSSPAVALGTKLPYGQMGMVCGVSPAQLGTKVDSYPETGRGYDLYDTAPGSTAPRTYYLAGFRDGCVRQFTAGLVMLGDPGTWEQLHYGAPGANLPRSEADAAYEAVKAQVCRVSEGQPCGARMRVLEKDTVFVNVYELFESSTRWKTVLLHDGDVVAMDLKG
jgi:hypothetical protein